MSQASVKSVTRHKADLNFYTQQSLVEDKVPMFGEERKGATATADDIAF